MSAAVTSRGYTSGGYATSLASGSFTPAANALILACIHLNSSTATASSGSGHGAMTRIVQTTNAATGIRAELWGVIASGSPSASALTINHSSTPSGLSVVEIATTYGAATIGSAIVQSAATDSYVGSGVPFEITVTLSTFAAGSMVVHFVASKPSTSTLTPQGSLTTDLSASGNGFFVNTSSFEGQDLTPGTNTSDNYAFLMGMAVEIKSAAGGAAGYGKSLTSQTFQAMRMR